MEMCFTSHPVRMRRYPEAFCFGHGGGGPTVFSLMVTACCHSFQAEFICWPVFSNPDAA